MLKIYINYYEFKTFEVPTFIKVNISFQDISGYLDLMHNAIVKLNIGSKVYLIDSIKQIDFST